MEIENIKTQTTWSEAAESINSNNLKIITEVTKLQSATYKNKGYFKTLSDLQSAFPTAAVGSKAYVGLSYPYAIYLWENNSWVDSGATGGEESVKLDQFYTKDETDSQISALEKKTGTKLTELSVKKADIKAGKNLLNPQTCVADTYIDATSGKTGKIAGVYASDYIAVQGQNLYLNKPSRIGEVIGWAAYDADKNYIHGENNRREKYIYQVGDVYVRFSLSSLDEAQVEIGQSATEYEPFNPVGGWGIENLRNEIQGIEVSLREEIDVFKDGFANLNIFNPSMQLYAEGKYCQIASGHISLSANAPFNTYILKVKANQKYSFNNTIRFVIPLADDKYSATSDALLQNITSIDTSNYADTHYIAISFNTTTIQPTSVVISEGDTPLNVIVPPKWASDYFMPKLRKESSRREILSSLSQGQYLSLGNIAFNASRKGERITTTMDVTNMGAIRLGFTPYAPQYNNYILVDSTKLSVYSYSQLTEVEHGLSIDNNLMLECEQMDDATIRVTIVTNGARFSKEFAFVKRQGGYPFILAESGAYTNVRLSWTNKDINKAIWIFGDSYLAYSAERWTYYLHQDGYDSNAMLDGYPGENGEQGYKALSYLIQSGTPRYAVWGYGMNDGSDADENTPSETWATYRDKFLSICEAEGITPIFATIPSVPIVNNEGKNKWVRESGYRYIDFAKAVGASSQGVWYNGMLSSDAVHPSEKGAIALYHQFITDVPEIFVG